MSGFDTSLAGACPGFKIAMDAVQAAIDRGDEVAASQAWNDARMAAAAFHCGVAFALKNIGHTEKYDA